MRPIVIIMFYVFFSPSTRGTQELCDIISGAATSGDDRSLISILLTPQLYIKFAAILVYSPTSFGIGLLYLLVMIVSLLIYINASFRASIEYMICVVMIGITIAQGHFVWNNGPGSSSIIFIPGKSSNYKYCPPHSSAEQRYPSFLILILTILQNYRVFGLAI